jgi:hypothetical protein
VFTMLTKINISKCSINICTAEIAAHSLIARLSKFFFWGLSLGRSLWPTLKCQFTKLTSRQTEFDEKLFAWK